VAVVHHIPVRSSDGSFYVHCAMGEKSTGENRQLHREQRIWGFHSFGRFDAVGRRLRKLFWLVGGIAFTSGIGFMMPKTRRFWDAPQANVSAAAVRFEGAATHHLSHEIAPQSRRGDDGAIARHARPSLEKKRAPPPIQRLVFVRRSVVLRASVPSEGVSAVLFCDPGSPPDQLQDGLTCLIELIGELLLVCHVACSSISW
jgi:hypothetical protein